MACFVRQTFRYTLAMVHQHQPLFQVTKSLPLLLPAQLVSCICFLSECDRMSWTRLWLALVVFRCLDSQLVRTFFSPDEYWQGPEVAHRLVFGTGILTWEWREGARIRTYLHPLLFAALFWVLKVLGLDTRDAVAYGPSLLQGLLAAVCDVYTFLLARRVFSASTTRTAAASASVAKWSLFVQASNWLNWYCSVRTFSGSLEVVIFTAALCHWLGALMVQLDLAAGKGHGGDRRERPSLPPWAVSWEERLALVLGTLGVVIRPTGAFLWVAPGLWRLQQTRQPMRYMLLEVGPVVLLIIGLCTALDSMCYGTLVLPAWNFLRFNLLEGKASLYGTHSFHWYWTQGLPTILTTQLPFFLLGLQRALTTDNKTRVVSPTLRILAYTCLIYVAGLSLSAHKEFRFLQPLLPLASLLSADGILAVLSWRPARPADDQASGRRDHYIMAFLLLTQCPMAWYLSRYHQRGPIDALSFLSSHITTQQPPSPATVSIHFLTPCHATPFITHLHLPHGPPLSLLHLDCSPEARASPQLSESDRFERDPLAFTDALYQTHPLPHYMLMFGSAAKVLEGRLKQDWGFTQVASFFYSSFRGDTDSPSLESSMLLYHRQDSR